MPNTIYFIGMNDELFKVNIFFPPYKNALETLLLIKELVYNSYIKTFEERYRKSSVHSSLEIFFKL